MSPNHKFVIITISDSCSAGQAEDKSGPEIAALVQSIFGPCTLIHELVPDDRDRIEILLRHHSDESHATAIFTTGGTGFGLRDCTPEATRNVLEKEAPQLAHLMIAPYLERTKAVALSRAVCGVRKETLIVNFPGSVRAVRESFEAIKELLPHIFHLLSDSVPDVKKTHASIQGHVCPSKTGTGREDDRNSPFPMIEVEAAMQLIFRNHANFAEGHTYVAEIDLPPFRASIKDGYAVKCKGGAGLKRVMGTISAGDPINWKDFDEDECYKINTGAAVPAGANAIIQVEDTRLISSENGLEKEIEILTVPKFGLDIREVGSDLPAGTELFAHARKPNATEKAICASVGVDPKPVWEPKIAVFSTGDELTEPGKPLPEGKIFDSNTVMLVELLKSFGYSITLSRVVQDTEADLRKAITEAETAECNVIVTSGGVSMGDKDYVKQTLIEKGYEIKFGRVNMKPGKPMTFAYNERTKVQFFGLPGNPVSAFVTFHLFVLPGLRKLTSNDETDAKVRLPVIKVELLHEITTLDPRPEYARATIIAKAGKLCAEITGNQISSRLISIRDADVLLHLPQRAPDRTHLVKGTVLDATILKHDFISRYED